jgi:hypothetical protein
MKCSRAGLKSPAVKLAAGDFKLAAHDSKLAARDSEFGAGDTNLVSCDKELAAGDSKLKSAAANSLSRAAMIGAVFSPLHFIVRSGFLNLYFAQKRPQSTSHLRKKSCNIHLQKQTNHKSQIVPDFD